MTRVLLVLLVVAAGWSEKKKVSVIDRDASVGMSDGGGGGLGCSVDEQCGTGSKCCSAVCVDAASCGFAPTALSVTQGWQNGGDFITLYGSGFAPGMKVYIGDG